MDWVDDPENGLLTDVQVIGASGGNAHVGDIVNLTFNDSVRVDSGSIGFSFRVGAGGVGLLPAGQTQRYDFAFTTNHDPVIPEPSTVLLFGTGLAGLAAWRWTRKQVA